MIQLVFEASDAADALDEEPVEVKVALARGAERSTWHDEKLDLVDGTHPVVYPAAGSHANKFTEALYLGSSAEAGVGCDDTRGPHREIRPAVITIPSDVAAAAAAFPWITFEGRWGEAQKAFFNESDRPQPEDAVDAATRVGRRVARPGYAVPTAGLLGTGATDITSAPGSSEGRPR